MKKILILCATFLAAFTLTRVVQIGPSIAHAASGDVVKAILWNAQTQLQVGTSTNPLRTDPTGTTTQPANVAQVNGTTTQANNSAAPPANGLLPAATAIANAVAPSWTEGNEVLKSVDLHGSQRITILNGVGSQVTNAVGSAVSAGVIMPAGKDGSGAAQLFGVGVTGATAPVNASMVGTKDAAGLMQPLPVLADNATASGNSVEVLPGISRAAPTSTTAGRATHEQIDTVSGGQYITESATSNPTGLTPFVASVNTTLNVKASAGNLYGIACVNANASVCYLQFYNTASTPTCGTAVVHSIPLTFGAAAGPSTVIAPSPMPLAGFTTGIGICMGTTATGATACTTANSCTLWIK
jgi:hypothetical protein